MNTRNTYNVKVIEYPNGEIQVRHYSAPVVHVAPEEYEKDMTFYPEVTLDYDLNPFTGKKAREILDTDAFLKSCEDNKKRSYNRTKNKVHEYSRCATWEMFVTFTFDPNKVDRYDFNICSSLIRKWLNNQRRNAPNLQYLIVPEMHKDGAYHFHGLLANTGNMKFTDSGKRTKEKQTIYNIGSWSYGFTTAIKVYETHGVSKYLAKYITKELCEITSGKHRYFVSTNMPTPSTTTFFTDSESDFQNLLNTLTDSLGVSIVHVSKPRTEGAYVDVDYYELQGDS